MSGKTFDPNARQKYNVFDLDYEENRNFVFALMVWLVRNKAEGKVTVSWEEIRHIWAEEKSTIKYDIVGNEMTLEVIDNPNV